MAWLGTWLYLVIMGCLFIGMPVFLIAAVLRCIFKSPWIHLPLALLIWGGVLSQLSVHPTIPEWRMLEIRSMSGLKSLYPALDRYQKAHGGCYPRRLSDLLPDYVPVKNLGWFFGRIHGQGPQEACIAEEGDFTAIDQQSLFVCLSGSGGMLAANRNPIVPKHFGTTWFHKPFRVVLYADGRVQSLPEKEYQQQIPTASERK